MTNFRTRNYTQYLTISPCFRRPCYHFCTSYLPSLQILRTMQNVFLTILINFKHQYDKCYFIGPQVFIDNFVHADLHPGNILVQGVSDYKPTSERSHDDDFDASMVSMDRHQHCPLRLVLLDTGIVGYLSDEDRKNLHQVFLAVALGKVWSG